MINRYGVDVDYMKKNLSYLIDNMENHTPCELYRALTRLTETMPLQYCYQTAYLPDSGVCVSLLEAQCINKKWMFLCSYILDGHTCKDWVKESALINLSL